MSDEMTPLDKLAQALQEFVNSIDDEAPVLLRGAVVAWESMILNDDGDVAFKVNYCSMPNTSMAETIGIMSLGKDVAMGDMLGGDDD